MNRPLRSLLYGCVATFALTAVARAQCPYAYLGFHVPTTRALFESRIRALGHGATQRCEPFLGHTVSTCTWDVALAGGRLEVTLEDLPAARPVDRIVIRRYAEAASSEAPRIWADSLATRWGSGSEERHGRAFRSGRCTAFVRTVSGHLEVELLHGLP